MVNGVKISDSKGVLIVNGIYVSVSKEQRFKLNVIKLDSNNLELLKTDISTLVFKKY